VARRGQEPVAAQEGYKRAAWARGGFLRLVVEVCGGAGVFERRWTEESFVV